MVGEKLEARIQAVGGRVVASHTGINVKFQHVPAGRISLLLAHLVNIVDGLFVIAPLDGLVQEVLKGFQALLRVIGAGVQLVHIGLILHTGALSQKGLVQLFQFRRTFLGQLGTHHGEGVGIAARFHENIGSLLDEGDGTGVGIDGGRQVIQRIVHLALADEDVGIGQLVILISGGYAHNLLQGFFGDTEVSALAGLEISGFQHIEVVAVDGSIVGINLGQWLEKRLGLLKIAHILVQIHLPEPQTLPIRVHFQQLVHIADGAGIVAGNLFQVHQQRLGIYEMIVDLTGFHQVVTGLVIVFTVPPVPAGQVMQAGFVGIVLHGFIQEFLTLGPAVLGEKVGHLLRVFTGLVSLRDNGFPYALRLHSCRHSHQKPYDQHPFTHQSCFLVSEAGVRQGRRVWPSGHPYASCCPIPSGCPRYVSNIP